jgi:hypothetical protein
LRFSPIFVDKIGVFLKTNVTIKFCKNSQLFEQKNANFFGEIEIKIKTSVADPSRQWLERRFLATEPISVVFDYLTVEGYPSDDFKVLSSWPRRDVSVQTPIFRSFFPAKSDF